MAHYQKGDYVKFEVTHEQSGEREWVWLSVDNSSDEQQVVFGQACRGHRNETGATPRRELCAGPRAQKSVRFSNRIRHHFPLRDGVETKTKQRRKSLAALGKVAIMRASTFSQR
jgi:hypothetical protein